MTCHAIQYSDRMECSVCHLAWDTNDPAPPRCPIAYTCPTCGRDSTNPHDAANKFCGVCGFEEPSVSRKWWR